MRELPHLVYLLAFEAAARHLSFTRAAEELNCTQAAISQRVRGLEQYFGRPLFSRKANGLELSQAGKAYLPGVSRALDVMESATSGLTGRKVRQSVTVSAPISFLNLWLAPRIGAFLKDRPDIGMRMNSAVWTDPNAELADLSVAVAERAAVPPNAALLAPAPLVLATAGGESSPGEIARMPQIEVQGKYPLWDLWGDAVGGRPASGATPLLVDTAVTALDLVAADAGCAVVYALYAQAARASGRRTIAHAPAEIGHVLILRANPGRKPNEAVRAFIDWVSGQFPTVEG